MKVDKLFDVVQPKETDKLDDEWQACYQMAEPGHCFLQGGKITGIKLEALPVPDKNGEVWIRLFEKKEKPGMSNPGDSGGDPWS